MQYLVTNNGELVAYDPNDPNQDEFLKKLFKKAKNVVSDSTKLLASSNPILRAVGVSKNRGYKTKFGKSASKVTQWTGNPKTYAKAAVAGAAGSALKSGGVLKKVNLKGLKDIKKSGLLKNINLPKLSSAAKDLINKGLESANPVLQSQAERLLQKELNKELQSPTNPNIVSANPLQSSLGDLTKNPIFIVVIAAVLLLMIGLIFKK